MGRSEIIRRECKHLMVIFTKWKWDINMISITYKYINIAYYTCTITLKLFLGRKKLKTTLHTWLWWKLKSPKIGQFTLLQIMWQLEI